MSDYIIPCNEPQFDRAARTWSDFDRIATTLR